MLAESSTQQRTELGAAGQRGAALRPDAPQASTPGATCRLPTPWAVFTMHGFVDPQGGKQHVALTLGNPAGGEPVLARVHSECLTGDAFQSLRCDCGAQLQSALRRIAEAGRGVLLYLRQEGRGIGLVNKIRAYALQDDGADTVDANLQLGLGVDLRRYECCKAMLDAMGVKRLRLMTNNPDKVRALTDIGVDVVERLPIRIAGNRYNRRYLATKSRRMAHWL